LCFLGRSFNWTFKKIDGGFNLGGSSLDIGSSDKSAHPIGVFVPYFFSIVFLFTVDSLCEVKVHVQLYGCIASRGSSCFVDQAP